ncbi:MAG: MFS transporter, partial [Caulobacteraceae bacterium]
MESTVTPPISVFRYHAFACFWAARSLSTLAVQAQSITIGWQVYAIARKTHSVAEGAFLVGMVGLAQFLPLFCLTFIAGATADRHDRRTIMLCCIAAEILCVSAFAALALQPHQALWPIFAIAAFFGATRAFLSPASGAMGPMLVPREVLPSAIAWNSMGSQLGSIIGPWIGGALCAASPAIAFMGSGVLYAAAGIALLLMRANTRPAVQAGSRLELIREGIVYVWTNKIVLGAITLDLFAVLLGGATALLPV